MKRTITLFIAAAALSAAVLVAVFGETSSAAPPRASSGALVALGKTALGKVLVDARGRTLYLFEKDKGAASSCYGACASVWPPLTSVKGVAAGGLPAAKLGATKRTDGKTEVTYAGHPLYTYAGDSASGQISGEGVMNIWWLVSPAGAKVKNAASSSVPMIGY